MDLARVVDTILAMYGGRRWWGRREPLEILMATVLSQRTYWKNAKRALENLKSRFGSLLAVAEADLPEVEEAIRPAGMSKARAATLIEVARLAARGELDAILELPYPEARKRLMKVKGIGPKTADVFLMFARGEPILPVDTHIMRVMTRLGFAEAGEGYEEVKARLEGAVPPSKRLEAHVALIEFGRRVCRPVRPLCSSCPFSEWCPSSSK